MDYTASGIPDNPHTSTPCSACRLVTGRHKGEHITSVICVTWIGCQWDRVTFKTPSLNDLSRELMADSSQLSLSNATLNIATRLSGRSGELNYELGQMILKHTPLMAQEAKSWVKHAYTCSSLCSVHCTPNPTFITTYRPANQIRFVHDHVKYWCSKELLKTTYTMAVTTFRYRHQI